MRTWPALVLSGFDAEAPADLVEAALLDFDVLAIEEPADNTWRVHFATGDLRDAARAALSHQFPSLSLQAIDVEDEDWAARSQAALRHVRVGHVIVAPPWDVPTDATAGLESKTRPTNALITGDPDNPPDVRRPGPDGASRQDVVIVIQPSMGFGTGHHATTRLCLAALQSVDLRGRSVLDIGTGSGVLAIAGSLLGAETVIGIDDDADAIHAARENAVLNPAAHVAFDVIDLRVASLAPAGVVLANLTGALLSNAASRLESLLAAGGTLIVSGLMDHEEADVRAAFGGLRVSRRDQEDEWLCLVMRRSSS